MGCWRGQTDRSTPCWGSPKPYWSPLASAGSWAGAEDSAGKAVLSLNISHLEGRFLPKLGSGAECQFVCGATANTFFTIYSSAALCCSFQHIFFSSQ